MISIEISLSKKDHEFLCYEKFSSKVRYLVLQVMPRPSVRTEAFGEKLSNYRSSSNSSASETSSENEKSFANAVLKVFEQLNKCRDSIQDSLKE